MLPELLTNKKKSKDFLDHLLRETPSKVNIALKRSYFSRNKVGTDGGRGGGREELGGGVEAMKGVYQSIRTAEVFIQPFVYFLNKNLKKKDH